MKKLFTILTLLCFSLIVSAQNTGQIAGRVIDTDNLPLPGANVYIESLKTGAVSDVNGEYTIVDIPAGTYDLSISYIGFQEEERSIKVEAGQTAVANFKLKPGIMLGEVEIGASLQGQAKALNQQNNSPNITNVVASDQVGRFPDANIGDALKRLPGVNVEYDQGEARFGLVRGTESRYNSVMINGERIPSAEAEDRTIQLDLIPSDMIQTIEVNKTLTPDMDADAIGGSINLVTRSNPAGFRVSGTFGVGMNFLTQKPIWLGSVIYGDRFAKDKLGIVLSASIYDHHLGSDNIEAEWTYDDANDNGIYDEGEEVWTEDFQVRQYYLQRIRRSISLSLDYRINDNNTLYVTGMFNSRDDYENRYRLRYKDIEMDDGSWISEVRRETKGGDKSIKDARLEDQKTLFTSLGGDHYFGNIAFDWAFSYASASEKRPFERYISYRGKDVPVDLDLSNTEKPQVMVLDPNYADLNNGVDDEGEYYWSLKDLTQEFQWTEDQDANFRFNLEIPLVQGNFKNSLKFGGKYRNKQKVRDNQFSDYEPLDEIGFNSNSLNSLSDISKSNFLAGDYTIGNFVSESYLGGLQFDDQNTFEGEQNLEEVAGNFDAKEEVYAGYIMLNQKFGEKIDAILGVRLENTVNKSHGYRYDPDGDEEFTKTPESKNDYLNTLPAILVNYRLNNTTVFRASWTNSIARPNYYDLVPYRQIFQEDNEIEIGNPDLNPTTSMNIDIMAEKYFRSVGIISGGLFYKDINDFIVGLTRFDYEFEGHTYDVFVQPINGGSATIFGAEISFQRQFDFLPGAWKGIGLYLNYTWANSSVDDFLVPGREGEDLSLPGSAEHTGNGSLSYEYKGFNIRASANFSSSFIEAGSVGEEAFYDRYYDNVFYLDLNASYAIKSWVRVFVEANNLTNQPLRYYQGIRERTMQSEYYNARITAGVKFDITK
jgi:TonB-dependent receptor